MSAVVVISAVVGLVIGAFAFSYIAFRIGPRMERLLSRWWTAPIAVMVMVALTTLPLAFAFAFGLAAERIAA